MKSEKNILIAFLLNLFFSIFEIFGGLLIGSSAILSDAVHDLGDSASIGLAYFFEKKSNQKPNEKYSLGFGRFSVLSSIATSLMLIISSLLIIIKSIINFFNPNQIDYKKMIVFAIVGFIVNLIAAIHTHKGDSINQKSVNLHMIEDVLGWIAVLIGAIIMKYTGLIIIDSILSIIVSVIILISAFKQFLNGIVIVLEKVPQGIDINEIKENLIRFENIESVKNISVWTLNGQTNIACITLLITSNDYETETKDKIRKFLLENHSINTITIETEEN